jgi:hypothetical protein
VADSLLVDILWDMVGDRVVVRCVEVEEDKVHSLVDVEGKVVVDKAEVEGDHLGMVEGDQVLVVGMDEEDMDRDVVEDHYMVLSEDVAVDRISHL